jgi:HK97 family phage major capsid protein
MSTDIVNFLLRKADEKIDQIRARGGKPTAAERAEIESYANRVKEIRVTEALRAEVDQLRFPSTGGGVASKTTSPSASGAVGFDASDLAGFKQALVEGLNPQPIRAKTDLLLSDAGIVGDHRTGTVPVLREPFRVRSLFPSETTDGPSVWYRQITIGAAQAAATGEGALKPEATIVAEQEEAPVRKIAAFLPMSEEVATDGGEQFVNEILGDLIADVIRAENAQLLTGSGTAPNLRGLLSTTGVLTQARGGDSNLDALIRAVGVLRSTSYLEPTDVVLNPANFETVRLAKDANGGYLLGSPLAQGQPALMGATIHVSSDVPAGTGLVVNAGQAATVYVRRDIQVQVGTSGDQWQRNLRAFIAEERLALAVKRPGAIVSVTDLE